MNWKRGLLRLWLAGTLIWTAYSAYGAYQAHQVVETLRQPVSSEDHARCMLAGGNPKCQIIERYKPSLGPSHYASMAVWWLAPPVGFLLGALGLAWIGGGFRKESV